MPRINVYLPETLHEAIKREGIPVSEVCQRALRDELDKRQREASAREAILWDRAPTNRRQ